MHTKPFANSFEVGINGFDIIKRERGKRIASIVSIGLSQIGEIILCRHSMVAVGQTVLLAVAVIQDGRTYLHSSACASLMRVSARSAPLL